MIADLERGWQTANHGISTLPTPIYITTFDATTLKRGAKQCFCCRSFDHTVHNCPFPVTSVVDEETGKIIPHVLSVTNGSTKENRDVITTKSDAVPTLCADGLTSVCHADDLIRTANADIVISAKPFLNYDVI